MHIEGYSDRNLTLSELDNLLLGCGCGRNPQRARAQRDYKVFLIYRIDITY